MQLPNCTLPIRGNEGHYIIGLNFFLPYALFGKMQHKKWYSFLFWDIQSNLRNLIWPERYEVLEGFSEHPETFQENINHLGSSVANLSDFWFNTQTFWSDHCGDTLQQLLMCHSDISRKSCILVPLCSRYHLDPFDHSFHLVYFADSLQRCGRSGLLPVGGHWNTLTLLTRVAISRRYLGMAMGKDHELKRDLDTYIYVTSHRDHH